MHWVSIADHKPAAAAIVRLPIKPSNRESHPPIELPGLDYEAGDELWRELGRKSISRGGSSSSSIPEALTPVAWDQPTPTKASITFDNENESVLPLRPAKALAENITVVDGLADPPMVALENWCTRQDESERDAPLHEGRFNNSGPIWKHLRPSKQEALRNAAAGIREANGREDLRHKSNELDPYGHVARLLIAGHGQSQLDQPDQLEVVSLPSSPDLEEADGFMLV